MVDNSFKEECIRMIVHVIVEIDIRRGLFEIIYIYFIVIRAIPMYWTIQMCHFGASHVIYMEIFFKNFNFVLESICGESILAMTFLRLETSKWRDT